MRRRSKIPFLRPLFFNEEEMSLALWYRVAAFVVIVPLPVARHGGKEHRLCFREKPSLNPIFLFSGKSAVLVGRGAIKARRNKFVMHRNFATA